MIKNYELIFNTDMKIAVGLHCSKLNLSKLGTFMKRHVETLLIIGDRSIFSLAYCWI